jgi:hypothetical protein
MHQPPHPGAGQRSHRNILSDTSGTFQTGNPQQCEGFGEHEAQTECATLVQELLQLVLLVQQLLQQVLLVPLVQLVQLVLPVQAPLVHLVPLVQLVAAKCLALLRIWLHLLQQSFWLALPGRALLQWGRYLATQLWGVWQCLQPQLPEADGCVDEPVATGVLVSLRQWSTCRGLLMSLWQRWAWQGMMPVVAQAVHVVEEVVEVANLAELVFDCCCCNCCCGLDLLRLWTSWSIGSMQNMCPSCE